MNSDVTKIKLATGAGNFWTEWYANKINGSNQVPGTEKKVSNESTGEAITNARVFLIDGGTCVIYAYDELSFGDFTFIGRKNFVRNIKTGYTLQCNNNDCTTAIDEVCGQCEVDVRVSPSEVWPKSTGGDTEAEVVVSLTEPAPSEGCTVNLSVEPVEDSGGHSHDSGRPKGAVAPNSISFSAGEVGVKTAKYISSEVAGIEKIKAELEGGGQSEEFEMRVRMPYLYPLPGGSYRLTGQTTTHPVNHYGTEYTVEKTQLMAKDFYKLFGATLGINDMSLQWGGLFDIGPPYGSYWNPPHKSHRKGTSVDVDRQAESPAGMIWVDRKIFERLCKKYKGRIIKEATIHCEFSQ